MTNLSENLFTNNSDKSEHRKIYFYGKICKYEEILAFYIQFYFAQTWLSHHHFALKGISVRKDPHKRIYHPHGISNGMELI